MRKPRDFDSEMKALADKAKRLRERKVRALGDLVVSTGADAMDLDVLAGALVMAANVTDAATREEWRRAGARFFQGEAPGGAGGAARLAGRAAADGSGAAKA
jgi:hypothetical protein